MLNETNANIKYDHPSNLLLYCDYFVSICNDLYKSDLQIMGIFDIIRCEYVKLLSIASGMYSDSKVYTETTIYDPPKPRVSKDGKIVRSNNSGSNGNGKKNNSEQYLSSPVATATAHNDAHLDS